MSYQDLYMGFINLYLNHACHHFSHKGSQVSILEDDVSILFNPTYLALISFWDVCYNSEV